jgi:iron complex outermembrane receptor protein
MANTVRSLLIPLAFATLAPVAVLAQTAVLNLPAQPLAESLKALGAKANINVMVSPALVDGRTAPALQGDVSAKDALARLLQGTGLEYVFINDQTVVIRERGPANKTPVARQASDWRRTAYTTASQAEPAASSDPTRPEDKSNAAQSETLQEIVVTAQKRVERLIETPQSVSVLSADALSKLGAKQLRDFADTVPGLTLQTAGAGFSQISMRGVTTGYDITPTVGIVVDDVPYGSSSAFARGAQLALDVGLFDVDRVEVLRGPQGTLYGASTMGGLIKYVTKQPDTNHFAMDTQAGVADTAQGGVSYNGALAVNAPLSPDLAAVRVSAFYSHDGGYIDNIGLDQRDVNRSGVYGGRLALLLTPTAAATVRLDGFVQNITRDGAATADYTLSGSPVYGPLIQRRLQPEPFSQQFRLISANLSYRWDWATLTSVSSYQSAQAAFVVDDTPFLAPVLQTFGLGSFSSTEVDNHTETDKFTQEVRLVSGNNQKLEWLFGAFYTHESGSNRQELLLLDTNRQPLLTNNLFHYLTAAVYKEAAAFADFTYHFTQALDISAGIRYARNEQSYTQIGSGVLIQTYPTGESSDNVLTYLTNARFRFDENAVAYVRFATGYRPGGPNAVSNDPVTGRPLNPPTFGADKLQSYEAGFKSESMDRRYSADIAAYYINWRDLQELTTGADGVSFYANAASAARINGAELTLTARPIEGFAATGSFAYQHAYLADAAPSLGAKAGERLPNVPRFTAALNVDYKLPSLASYEPTIGATVRSVTDRESSFSHSSTVTQYRLPAYTMFDARAGIAFGNTTLQLYVHNLFNRVGQLIAPSGLTSGSGPAEISILQPRTVGLTATVHL